MSVTVLNTTASLSGKTLLKAEDSQTITGQKTFDVGASAPFVVVSGAAVVTNLDADKCDGEDAADFHDAAQLTGVIPATVVGPAPGADRAVFWDHSLLAFAYLEFAGLAIRGTQLVLPRTIPCGRLTLTTGVPITIGDVTAATSLFYALYGGNQIALYNGASWEMFAIAELTIAVPSTADTNYDVFVNYAAGTPALSVQAWSNSAIGTQARHAAGIYATALPTQDGVYVQSTNGTVIDATKRYVGTFRTTSVSGQTEDSLLKRYVWNYYHRVPRLLRATDATDNWNYTTATWRQVRATATNQVEAIIGVAEELIDLQAAHFASNSGLSVMVQTGIGEDSTSAPASGSIGMSDLASITLQNQGAMRASLQKYPAVGYHFYAWLERSAASGTTTWYGDNGDATLLQTGLSGSYRG